MNYPSTGSYENYITTDKTSGITFLVDSGARVSVISATWRDKHSGTCNQTLQAANGTPITTYGARNVLLQLENTVTPRV